MTISEAIEELRSRKLTMSMCIDIESCRNANNAIDMSISALEENTKLKAEIEKLIEYIENQKKLYEYRIDLQLKYSDRNHEEIEQLKSELEQLVRLPNELECKMKNFYWKISDDTDCIDAVHMQWANRMNTKCIELVKSYEPLKCNISDKQREARIDADNVKKDFKEFCDSRDIEESKLKFREVE